MKDQRIRFCTGVFAVLLMVIMAAGLSVAQDNGLGAASFELIASSDSERTLGRHYTVTRYLDVECNKPKKKSRIFRKKFAKDTHEFSPIEINTGEIFIFQVDYAEKRRDTERSCSASLGFTPEAGRSYRAAYRVTGQVSTCNVSLLDITEGEVEVQPSVVPEIMCTKKGATGNGNGIATHAMIDRF